MLRVTVTDDGSTWTACTCGTVEQRHSEWKGSTADEQSARGMESLIAMHEKLRVELAQTGTGNVQSSLTL